MKLTALWISKSAANFMIDPVAAGLGWHPPWSCPDGVIMKLAGWGSAFWAVNFMIVRLGGIGWAGVEGYA